MRLNGTSDLDWDGMAPNLMARIVCMGVIRYDYTKVPNRIKRESNDLAPAQAGDYRLCFSLSETNDSGSGLAGQGGNVAVVFRTAALPTHLQSMASLARLWTVMKTICGSLIRMA
jgi:hypothetical protein